MKKYEKFIAITLIFIMLFNIIGYKKVNADMDNITKAGLIAFLITMNIYNVATNTTNAVMTLFNDFWSKKTNSEQNDFVNSFKNVWKNSFTSGIISVVSMPMIHSWIRENFSSGYNNKIKEGIKSDLIINNFQSHEKVFYLNETRQGSYYVNGYGAKVVVGIPPNKTIIQFSNGQVKTYSGVPDPSPYVNKYFTIRVRYDKNTNKVQVHSYWAANQDWVYIPYVGIIEDSETEIINYYAGEAVDYPMERDVEDKYIPLPVPDVGMGIPGLDYDVGGNRVYDGTVDQFLDDALGNADYLDSTIDKLLEGGYNTSLPNVNVDAGTITWPATGSVTYPDTGVIEYPDVTIPEGIEEGIGETNSILQGIGSFVESIFSAPTVELDLSPLTNVNLKEKFPFCLPFDLSNLITGLKVDDAEVPNIELNFEVLNDEYTIPLNFDIFSDWAIIVNWFVLILFIIGLIMISRKLIGG